MGERKGVSAWRDAISDGVIKVSIPEGTTYSKGSSRAGDVAQ